jgi:hypothetical protein
MVISGDPLRFIRSKQRESNSILSVLSVSFCSRVGGEIEHREVVPLVGPHLVHM